MRDDVLGRVDDSILEKYLDGALSAAETRLLLDHLACSPELVTRLDALRARWIQPEDLDFAQRSLPDSPNSLDLPVDLLQPTPPLLSLGSISGALSNLMGPSDASPLRFGPDSPVDITLEPETDLEDDVPLALLLADDDGCLHPTGLTPTFDDDEEVYIFAAPGRRLFPWPGEWTLVVVVGADDPEPLAELDLQALLRTLPKSRVLTTNVRYTVPR